MKVFKDKSGREWEIDANVASLIRARDLAGVDLLTWIDESGTEIEAAKGMPLVVARLQVDIQLLCKVLFAVCRPKATELGIDEERFASLLGGEALWVAGEALTDEIVGFTRDPRQREVVSRVLSRFRAKRDQTMKEMTESLGDERLEAALEMEAPPAHSSSRGGARGFSGSTRDH